MGIGKIRFQAMLRKATEFELGSKPPYGIDVIEGESGSRCRTEWQMWKLAYRLIRKILLEGCDIDFLIVGLAPWLTCRLELHRGETPSPLLAVLTLSDSDSARLSASIWPWQPGDKRHKQPDSWSHRG